MPKQAADNPIFPSPSHDHKQCVAKAMAAAEATCLRQGGQLTDLRREVLAIVWESHVPVGAYEILSALTKGGRRPAPPTVYRALDFLLAQGLVHRIESKNAYVGCQDAGGKNHQSQFLICKICGQTVEVSDERLESAILELAKTSGFALSGRTIELQGICPACQSSVKHEQ